MDLDASLALHAQGKDQWNAWAASMIEWRRVIVAAGEWSWARDSRADVYSSNAVTGKWRQDASAQFSYHEFADAPDFTGFIFPGAALFVASKLPHGGRFRTAQFRDGACFNFTRFGGIAEFEDVVFYSGGEFDSTLFLGEALFDGARFEQAEFEPTSDGRLDCTDAKFKMLASFARIHCVDVVLSDTEFEQTVSFEGACVSEMFFLYQTVFRGPVLVEGAKFAADVDWSGANVVGAVADAKSQS